jgi:hypothetical protein
LAVKFTDNKVKRAVWGHGRFGRSDIRGLESHFKAIPAWGVWYVIMLSKQYGLNEASTCRNGHFVSFHWVTPADNTVFLAEHHRFELSLDYAMASNLPDLENLINLFEPVRFDSWPRSPLPTLALVYGKCDEKSDGRIHLRSEFR